MINGETSPIPAIAMANPLVDMVTQLLAEVRAGRISSMAVVAVTPQGAVGTPYAGGQRADMYLGAGLLQDRILQDIKAPPQRSSIIRATVGG